MTKEYFLENIDAFILKLQHEEKSESTIKKYRLGIRTFINFADSMKWPEACKDGMIEYKRYLEKKYKLTTANLYIIALNSYLTYINMPKLCLKTFIIQEKNSLQNSLTVDDYSRMLKLAEKQKVNDNYYIMRTIANTGIRISELEYITVKALKKKECEISNKGKTRFIVISQNICDELLDYCSRKGIKDGYVFYARNPEKCISEPTVLRRLKKIAVSAGVEESRAFPHNFRHLFARRYMEKIGNITGLKFILGHSNIKSTMIYTCTSNDEKRRDIEKLDL